MLLFIYYVIFCLLRCGDVCCEALQVEASTELRLELARCLTERAIELKAAGHGELRLFQEAIQVHEAERRLKKIQYSMSYNHIIYNVV